MKSSGSSLSIYVVAIVIAVVIATLVAQCHKSPAGVVPIPPTPLPQPTSVPAAPASTPAAANFPPTPVSRTAALSSSASTTVTIQDGKTIDFSSGKPVVRDDAKEKALIDSAVKEMDAVASGVTFGPAQTTPTPSVK